MPPPPELPAEAIRWEGDPPPRLQPPDLLALTDRELVETCANALADRDVYRELALAALTTLQVLTAECDRLRCRVQELET